MATKSVIPSRDFDNIFEKYRGDIPISYLRALAMLSSGMNPKKSFKNSGGLFMISKPALDVYDLKHPKQVPINGRKVTDLADPGLSTRIAVWILTNIKQYYARNFPKCLSVDWNNLAFVGLLTYGYKVGYTKSKGIGEAMAVIEGQKGKKCTVDNVANMAKMLKMDESKYSPSVVNFAKNVANLYSIDLGKTPIKTIGPTKQKGGGAGIALALSGAGLLLLLGTRGKTGRK